MFKKENICFFVTGLAVGITVIYVFWFYQVSKIAVTDHNTVNQIVDFLNKNSPKSTESSNVTK